MDHSSDTTRTVGVLDAAKALEITPDAVRAKLRRGTLEEFRDNRGNWHVVLPDTTRLSSDTTADTTFETGRHDTDTTRHDGEIQADQAVEEHLKTLKDQLAKAQADAAAAHERLGMALTLVGQIQADAEKERSRLIAEIETQRQEAARDRGAAQAEHDRLVWDALQARQEAQKARERADSIPPPRA